MSIQDDCALPWWIHRVRPGPVALSCSRVIWWTGKVAIGLRHERPHRGYVDRPTERDAERLQTLCLKGMT